MWGRSRSQWGGALLSRRHRMKTHDADSVAERLGREVAAELGADHARLAVRAGDLAPDDADLGATDRLLRGVDVGDALVVGEDAAGQRDVQTEGRCAQLVNASVHVVPRPCDPVRPPPTPAQPSGPPAHVQTYAGAAGHAPSTGPRPPRQCTALPRPHLCCTVPACGWSTGTARVAGKGWGGGQKPGGASRGSPCPRRSEPPQRWQHPRSARGWCWS